MTMAFSRHSHRPDWGSDLFGFLRWEYDRLRTLTMRRSAKFAYGHNNGTSEETKGAASVGFAFEAVHGDDYGSNCSVSVDGDKSLKQCSVKYLKPLWRLQKTFMEYGTLPPRCEILASDSSDEHTMMKIMLQGQYRADVLTGWFRRARKILLAAVGGLQLQNLDSVFPFVPERELSQSSWDWAAAQVQEYRSAHPEGAANAPKHIIFMMKCVDELPRPVLDAQDDPSQWSLGADASTSAHTSAPHAHAESHDEDPALPSLGDVSSDEESEFDSDESDSDDDEDPPPVSALGWSSDDAEEPTAVAQEEAQADIDEAVDRAMPTIPEYVTTGTQDYTAIAAIHLASAFFTPLKLIENIPVCYREAWAKANTQVYQWIEDSVPGTREHDCALFWELMLHRILLRAQPKSRGRGRPNKDNLSARFKAFQEGDFRFLIDGLERACAEAARRRPTPDRHGGEERLVGKVQRLLAKGLFSKAYRILDSQGQASLRDQGVVAQLDAKHGVRDYELPGHLPQDLPRPVKIRGPALGKVYSKLKPLAGTGPCGYRNEYLICLATEMLDPDARKAVSKHANFATAYVNAELPKWYYHIASATAMIALVKKAASTPHGTPDVRPIGMGGCRRRAWISMLIQDNADVFKKTFWPVQVAVGVKAGVTKLIYAVTEHMRAHPGHTLLKLDFTNAFNSVWRGSILKECYDNKEWRHLYRFFWANLSPRSRIMAIHALSEEGVQQGDPSGPAGFCIALHRHAVWAHERLRAVGGMSIFDMDDGYMMGPIEPMMQIVQEFQVRLQKHVGAVLNASKCELWCSDHSIIESYLREHPDSQFRVGSVRQSNGKEAFGVMVSGVPFGDDEYVQEKMMRKVDKVVSQIQSTTKRLRLRSCQNLYALLVQCLNTKIQFWLQCMRPQLIRHHLHRLDEAILTSARTATGMPLKKETLAFKRLRWSRRLYGGMLRSAVDVHAAAYLGGICQCVPSFTTSVNSLGRTSPGVLDHMDTVYGVGSFDAGNEETRFQCVLDSGTRLGDDLQELFDQLKQESHGSEPLDQLPMDSPFKLGAPGVGVILGNVEKRPQHTFTEAREDARADATRRALRSKLRAPRAKPTREEVAYLSANKLNVQFVAVPAMRRTVMDNALFQEAWSRYLGSPSPACRNWVGISFKPCRGKKRSIDEYGDNVARSHVRGDGWRTRHDALKWAIVGQADWCQYKLHVEPPNVFLPYIRQRETFMSNVKQRNRQGLVPDLLDMDRNVLMDVKGVTWGNYYRPIRFHKARTCRAVMYRSRAVHKDYQRKAAKIDVEYNEWRGPGPGPVQHKLQQFGRVEGLVAGVHGEGSKDLLELLNKIAERGAACRYRQMGFASAKAAFSTVKKQVYMVVGIEAIRGSARLTLTNLASILAGSTSNKAAATRRSAARMHYTQQVDTYWSTHCHFDTQ